MGSDFVILWRNTQNGCVSFVSNDKGDLATFPSEATAEAAALETTVCRAFPYQIVEVEC